MNAAYLQATDTGMSRGHLLNMCLVGAAARGIPVVLPKQWRHWVRSAGLRPTHRQRRASDWLYLKGRGFVWRVSCYGMLQRGDPVAEFDRWALCGIDECMLPQSEAEFRQAVKSLAAEYSTRSESTVDLLLQS